MLQSYWKDFTALKIQNISMNYYWQQNHEILLGWDFQLFQLDILYSIVPENIYNFPAEEILLLTPLKILITLHRFLFLLVMQNPSPIARKIQSFLWGWGLEDMVIFWNYTLNSLDFRTSLYLPVPPCAYIRYNSTHSSSFVKGKFAWWSHAERGCV